MGQLRTLFLVSFGVFFGVLNFSNEALAQFGDGHGGVSDSYRRAADLYRQAAAQSPANAACYLRLADYYQTLANYQTPAGPVPDANCGGSGSVGGSGAVSPVTPSGSGSQGWWGAGLQAAGQIAQAWQERLQRQQAERQAAAEQQRQAESQQESGDGAETESHCGHIANNPMVDMYMQDYRRRTGECQPNENGQIWLNEGVPGTTYSGAPGGVPGQSDLDPFQEAEPIDRSNEPCMIEFPSGNTPPCSGEVPAQIDFPGDSSGGGAMSVPPTDKNGVIQGGELDIFQEVSRKYEEIQRKQGLGRQSFSQADGTTANDPCVIDFPSGNTKLCTNKVESEITFPGAGSNRGTVSVPPTDKNGVIQGGEFDIFQEVSRKYDEIARKQGLGRK